MQESVLEALRQVIDPELGVNIVDLGLVYLVQLSTDRLSVDMTMTTAACPMAEFLRNEAQQALETAFPSLKQIDVNLVWDPPWSPDKISETARQLLGWKPQGAK